MELFTPDFGLIFWMFVAFAILFIALYKWGWPAILKGVDSRADLIDKGVEYAQNAKEQLEHAREESDKYIADARRRQADIMREADKMKTQIIEQARDEARAAAKKEMDAAKVAIEQERKQAEQDLRNQVGALALEVADKVVRVQMKDDQAQQKLVDKLMNEMETPN